MAAVNPDIANVYVHDRIAHKENLNMSLEV